MFFLDDIGTIDKVLACRLMTYDCGLKHFAYFLDIRLEVPIIYCPCDGAKTLAFRRNFQVLFYRGFKFVQGQ
ncbi:MAG TPA: hypothetical protein DIW81_09370 [Planctomycetaceae bacterium]|nr:hypothetical protein [Planctomycetaceae bacterium]